MFDATPRDMVATLSEMERRSRERTRFNQAEARNRMVEWISQDARFQELDPERVAERVQKCRSNGATFDIDDPFLKRDGRKRPLDRSQY